MAVLDEQDRVVVLLYLLGDEANRSIVSRLPEEYAAAIQRRLDDFENDPPGPTEIDEVLSDFEQSLAMASNPPGALLQAYRPAEDDDPEDAATGRPFEPTDDPIDDLCRLTCHQIAGALSEENPQTAALVLSCLPADRAAETLQRMPEPLQTPTFMRMGQSVSTPTPLLLRVVKTTVTRAAAVEEQAEEEPQGDQKMVDMLRSMDKKSRTQLLDLIADEDPDLAEQLRAQMFVFEDILRVEPRSLQKLLMELETDTLLTALQKADSQLIDRIMSNVPKRTREALNEEMQYMVPAPEEQVAEARATVAKQIMELDRAGQLIFES